MSRKSAVTLMGMMVGLVAFVACGGGETGSQEAGAGEAAETQMSETAMAEGGAAAQQEIELPEGVTMEMVSQGQEVFAGAGLCYVCHGTEGQGMPGLGSDLTDSEWTHGDGSFANIVETVMNGVDSSASGTGSAMPPKGGSGITDEQVRQVAAYVYSLRK